MATVWYVAYGSNVGRNRFGCYLAGGRPAGGSRDYPGCRDTNPPTEERSIELPGRLVFAGRSLVWTGGLALYDATRDGTVAGRAYRVTVEQFADVAAQETRNPPGGEFAVALEAALPALETAYVHGPGNYETLHRLGEYDGSPLLTITRDDVAGLQLAAPAPAYLWWVGTGVRDAHGWTDAETTAYLLDAPGVQGAWESADVMALLRETEPPEALC
jgi:hypothetical protein